jgi:pyridoxamine 5'-phosphate oxidase
MSAFDEIFDAPAADPMAVFDAWLTQAAASELNDANAMSLATVDGDGMPNARMVLLKGHDQRGFVFYTNLNSQKGAELYDNARAALCFHWKSLHRQVRVQGPVSAVSEQEADAYFTSRGAESRLGAWASQQSQTLQDRATLDAAYEAALAQYGEENIPRPPHWSGRRITPLKIEFWQDGAHRLHNRLVYQRAAPTDAWSTRLLYP